MPPFQDPYRHHSLAMYRTLQEFDSDAAKMIGGLNLLKLLAVK